MTERRLSPTAANSQARKACSVAGCERPSGESRGLCAGHYTRWRRDGDVRAEVPLGSLKTIKATKPCAVEGCGNKAKSRGWCRSHYANWRRHGDPTTGLNQQHGMHETPEYRSWRSMKTRCDNPNTKNWSNWGGRGISYDPSWVSFPQFLKDMGPRPDGTSLDRIDNDANYGPGNCRWATPKEQASNRRPSRKEKVA